MDQYQPRRKFIFLDQLIPKPWGAIIFDYEHISIQTSPVMKLMTNGSFQGSIQMFTCAGVIGISLSFGKIEHSLKVVSSCVCFCCVLPLTVYLICLHILGNFYSSSLFFDLRNFFLILNQSQEVGRIRSMVRNTQLRIKQTWVVFLCQLRGYLLRSGHLIHLLFLSIST